MACDNGLGSPLRRTPEPFSLIAQRFQAKPLLRATFVFLLLTATPPLLLLLNAREKDAVEYGAGLIVNVPMPEAEVTQAVEEVSQNGIIRGTKEYNKDEYITGAAPAASSRLFPAWTDGGKILYKVRTHALDPRNFKGAGDVGTLAVRYVVQGQGDKNTVLRIDAVFVEEFRHTVHASNGSVEGSEYKVIHDHLEAMELMKQQTIEAEKESQAQLLRKQQLRASIEAPAVAERGSSTMPAEDHMEKAPVRSDAGESSAQSLEQHVKDLRRQVERLVKAPGAPLKSAPFHTASTLQSLASGTEVVIVISTPYWYGIETHDGQHGWIPRDQLEQLP
jgi:hypothetical protein